MSSTGFWEAVRAVQYGESSPSSDGSGNSNGYNGGTRLKNIAGAGKPLAGLSSDDARAETRAKQYLSQAMPSINFAQYRAEMSGPIGQAVNEKTQEKAKARYETASTQYENKSKQLDKLLAQSGDYAGYGADLEKAKTSTADAKAKMEEAADAYRALGGTIEADNNQRVGKTIAGGAENYLASLLGTVGSYHEGGVRGSKAQIERDLADLQTQADKAQQTYDEMLAKYGDENNVNVKAAASALAEIKSNQELYQGMLDNQSLERTSQAIYGASDRMAERGAQDIAEAKEGLGAGGQFLVDTGAAGVQLLGDIALGKVTGLGMMPVMGARSYGGGANEARQAGATYEQQFLAGGATAAVEMLTEKLADGLAGVAGKGAADDAAKEIIRKWAKTDAGRTALRAVYGISGEAGEEAISTLVSPLIERIYNDEALKESYGTAEGRKQLLNEALHDALVGGALGGLGTLGSFGNGQNAAELADMRMRDAGADVGSQTNNAFDVLFGRMSPEQAQAREAAALARLNVNEQAAPAPAVQEAPAPVAQETTGQDALLEAAGITPAELEVQNNSTQQNIDNAVNALYNGINENVINEGVNTDVSSGGPSTDSVGVPGVYGGRDADNQGQRGLDGTPVDSGLGLLSEDTISKLQQSGVYAGMQDSSANNVAFSAALDEARASDTTNGWAVTPKSAEELNAAGTKTYMDANGTAGFAVASDGDIEAVFANKTKGAPKGVSRSTIPQAIAAGGVKLDCYGAALARLYSKHGFVPVARVTFNPEYANDGWDASKGAPDIYFMMYTGGDANSAVANYGTYPILTQEQLDALPLMEYDDAYSYRDSLLEQSRGQGESQEAGAPPTPPAGGQTTAESTNGEGFNAYRAEDQATARNTDGSGRVRERSMSRNLRNNDKAELELRNSFEQNRDTYTQLTNAEAVEKANEIISKGFDEAKQEVIKAIGAAKAGWKLAPEMAVAGYHLANEMTRRGDIQGARILSADIAAELTYGGRLGQIGRVILSTDPSVRILTVEKLASRLSDGLTARQREKNIANTKATAESAVAAAEAAKEEAVKRLSDQLAKGAETELETGPFNFADQAAIEVAKSIKAKIKNAINPKAAQKNALDTFVNYVKRFASEKVSLDRPKAKPTTATDLLREVANNEELFREVYEKAQAQFSGEDATGYREFVADYLNTPVGLDGTGDAKNKIFMRAIAESAIATQENAKLIQQQAALGVPIGEIARTIANDLISKTGAEGGLAESITGAATAYVNQVLSKDALDSDARSERIVKNMMEQIGLKFREVAVQNGATKESIRQDIADMLATEFALSPSSAEKIAESVGNEYDLLLSDAMQKEVERRFAPKERNKPKVKELSQVLTEAINLGAFDGEYARNAINKIFGVDGEIVVPSALLEEYANAETDEAADAALTEIQKNIASQIPATFRDKFTALRYLNMLGNLKTQGRNLIGNALMLAATNVKYTTQASIEGLVHAFNKNYQRNTALVTSAQLREQAAADFDANLDEIKGESKYTDVAKQSKSEIEKYKTTFGSGESSEWASKLLSKLVGHDVDVKKNVFENYKNLTNWAMDAGDVIFMRTVYIRSFAGWMKSHGVSDVSNATPEQITKARAFAAKEAQEATFHDSNAVSDAVVRFDKNFGPFGKTLTQGVMPFRRTTANVGVRGVEYSPVGLAETIYKGIQALNGKGDATAADVINSLSKNVSGTALLAAGFFLAKAGLARGSNDDDDKELSAFEKMQGAMDYSVKIGGRNVSLSQFAPMAVPFFMGVKLNELMDRSDEPLSLDDAKDILGIVSEPMLEMSLLSGVNDFLNDLSSMNGDTDAMPSLVANAAINYLSQGITNSLIGQFEQANEGNRQTTYTDTKSGEATDFDKRLGSGFQRKLAGIAAKIPGIDYHQQDYVDAWGRTQSTGAAGERYFNALLNPTYISKDNSTEVDAELERLYTDNKDIEGFPDVLPKKRARSAPIGDGIVMTPDEYLQFSKDSGAKKLELVKDFIESDQYKGLTDQQRADIISNLYSLAESVSLDKIKENYNISRPTDWDRVKELEDPVEYLAGKEILMQSGSEYKGTPDYSQIDSLLAGWGNLSADTQAELSRMQNVNNMRYAYDQLGVGSGDYFDTKNTVTEAEKSQLGNKTGGAADAIVIAKTGGKTDEEKLAALEALNQPDKQTGKRAAVVRRFEAAAQYNIPFDQWAAFEAAVYDNAKNPASPSNQAIYAAEDATGIKRGTGKAIWRKISGDENKVEMYDDYFSQYYEAPDQVSFTNYLANAAGLG